MNPFLSPAVQSEIEQDVIGLELEPEQTLKPETLRIEKKKNSVCTFLRAKRLLEEDFMKEPQEVPGCHTSKVSLQLVREKGVLTTDF